MFFRKRLSAIDSRLEDFAFAIARLQIQGTHIMINLDKMTGAISGLHDAVAAGAAKIAELAAAIAAANTAGDQAAVDAAADQVAAEAKALADAVTAATPT